MFEPKQTEAFRSIAAPGVLKERILAEERRRRPRRNRITMSICSAAACLVLVALVPMMQRQNAPVYTVAGIRLSDETVSLDGHAAAVPASARTPDDYTAVISADISGKTTLSLDSGSMELLDTHNGAVLASGTQCVAEGDVIIHWHVDADEAGEHVMTVRSGKTEHRLILCYDAETAAWQIRQTPG